MSTISTDDQATTIHELKTLVKDFVAARQWEQFHSPKNLSMSLAIEAAELMEHFQWLTTDESRAVGQKAAQLSEVGEELADVLAYALALANVLQLDIATIMRAKMVKNERKYPAGEFRGRFG